MEFDHKETDKKFNVSAGTALSSSIKRLIEEIVKCDVVCANCHRVRGHLRGEYSPKPRRIPASGAKPGSNPGGSVKGVAFNSSILRQSMGEIRGS